MSWLRRKVEVALFHCGISKGREHSIMGGNVWLPGKGLYQTRPQFQGRSEMIK
jgi:hypothetical protein